MTQRSGGFNVPAPVLWGGLAALCIAVAVLVALALQSAGVPGNDTPPELKLSPIEVPSQPEPTAEPEPALVTPSAALITMIDNEAMWRTTGGSCVAGEESDDDLVIERGDSPDEWVDVTPTNFDVRDVLFMASISSSAVEAVVLLGPDCEPQTIRSFTSGQFWEPYDDSIRGAVYAVSDGTEIVTPEGTLEAPCEASMRNLSGQAETAKAFVCEGQLQWATADGWVATELPGIVSASPDPAHETVVTASIDVEGCDGTLVQRWSGPEDLVSDSCEADVDVKAVFANPDTAWLWESGGMTLAEL